MLNETSIYLYFMYIGDRRLTPTIENLLCHFCTHLEVVEVDGGEEEVYVFNQFCFARHGCDSKAGDV
jgi:hypothetical protein